MRKSSFSQPCRDAKARKNDTGVYYTHFKPAFWDISEVNSSRSTPNKFLQLLWWHNSWHRQAKFSVMTSLLFSETATKKIKDIIFHHIIPDRNSLNFMAYAQTHVWTTADINSSTKPCHSRWTLLQVWSTKLPHKFLLWIKHAQS